MPTLDSKGRSLGGLSYAGKHVVLEVSPEGLRQADGGGALALPEGGGRDPSHHHIVAALPRLQAAQAGE